MHQPGLSGLLTLLGLLAFAPCLPRAAADAIITKGGNRIEGKVERRENGYLLTTPDGTTITFPHNIVDKVVRSVQAPASDSGIQKKDTQPTPPASDSRAPQTPTALPPQTIALDAHLARLAADLSAIVGRDSLVRDPGKDSEESREARDLFRSAFREDIDKVELTATTSDDAALAGRLLEAAKVAGMQPDFLALVCDSAWKCGSKSHDGYAPATQAMLLLAEKVPNLDGPCRMRILLIKILQCRAAPEPDRGRLSRQIINDLLAAAEIKAQGSDYASARVLARHALDLAKHFDLPGRAEIDAGLQHLDSREKSLGQATALAERLRANPQDSLAAQTLLRLCLVELDSPAEAAKYAGFAGDERTRRYILLATMTVARLPDLACLELGDWYWGFAKEARGLSRAAMLRRAKSYYSSYLEKHTDDDMSRTKALVLLQKVNETLDECLAHAGGGAYTFFSVDVARARKIVYVVDRSGSMTDSIDYVKFELKRSIGELGEDTAFHVIFYSSGPPVEMPTRRLVNGTDRNKQLAFEFVDGIIPQGETDPSKALERAFAVGPELIYLLTDGEFDRAIIDLVKRNNTGGKVTVHTIGFLYRTGEEVLKSIAAQNNGNYKFVSEADLATLANGSGKRPKPAKRLFSPHPPTTGNAGAPQTSVDYGSDRWAETAINEWLAKHKAAQTTNLTEVQAQKLAEEADAYLEGALRGKTFSLTMPVVDVEPLTGTHRVQCSRCRGKGYVEKKVSTYPEPGHVMRSPSVSIKKVPCPDGCSGGIKEVPYRNAYRLSVGRTDNLETYVTWSYEVTPRHLVRQPSRVSVFVVEMMPGIASRIAKGTRLKLTARWPLTGEVPQNVQGDTLFLCGAGRRFLVSQATVTVGPLTRVPARLR